MSDTDGNLQDNIQGRGLNIITYLVFRDERAGNDLKNRQIHLYKVIPQVEAGHVELLSDHVSSPSSVGQQVTRVAVPFSCRVANPMCEAAEVTTTVT